jgi:tripartite-type tricarboxylate transporter receptor subunit TctC
MLRFLFSTILPLIAVVTTSVVAHPQDYPSRPIRVIVGYPPGASVDFTARIIADHLKGALGQPVIVDNRPGAGGVLAAEYVSRAEADGYTLLYGVGSDLVWTKYLTKRATVDPLKDLTPIATAIASVNGVAVNARHPAKSFAELVELTRGNSGKLTYGTSGVQSYYYIIGEALRQQGMDMLHVPYKGNAPVVSALLTQEVDVALINLGSLLPHVANGTLRVLALMEPKRYAGAPDIPTISEVLPTFNAPTSWFGFFGPPSTPQPIVEKLNDEVRNALQSPAVLAKIRSINANVLFTGANEIRSMIVQSDQAFSDIIKTMNIKDID